MKDAKQATTKIKSFFKNLGPGLVTGASDDDPSGIATYSQAGAQFGLATLWTALITFPLMTAIQEMCARIGAVTSKGLTTIIKKHYPAPILYLVILLTVPAIILNIAADLAAMGAVANLLLPSISNFSFMIFLTLLLIGMIVYCSYQKIAAILKYLCLSLLLYIIVPFLTQPNLIEILKNTFVPHLLFDKSFFNILVAILGTTISPYLFFWQTTMEAEEQHHHKKKVNKHLMRRVWSDVTAGMFLSNIVMYFIILTTGTVLYQAGIHEIETVEQAAQALQPLAGNLSYLLFAIGIIGTGLLAIPVLTSSISYILTATFDFENGLDRRFRNAKVFYSIMVLSLLLGLAIDFIGISPIRSLIYAATLYGLCAPILILVVLHIANNQKIMGRYRNALWSNLFGLLTFLLMTFAAVFLLYFEFT